MTRSKSIERAHPSAGRSPARAARWLIPYCAGLLVCGMHVADTHAASGDVHVFLDKTMRMVVDTRWVDAAGYRPVRIRLEPVTPRASDRTVTVELKVMGMWTWNDEPSMVVREAVLLRAGQEAEFTISVPQLTPWYYYKVTAWEDGRVALSEQQHTITNADEEWTESWPSILIISERPHDTSELAKVLGVPAPNPSTTGSIQATAVVDSTVIIGDGTVEVTEGDRTDQQATDGEGQGTDGEVADGDEEDAGVATTNLAPSVPNAPPTSIPVYASSVPATIVVPPEKLPLRWIDYTCLDIICVSQSGLRAIAEGEPQRFAAIENWARAGGNLIVYGVRLDGSSDGLAALETTLGVTPASNAVANASNRGWNTPRQDHYRSGLDDLTYSNPQHGYYWQNRPVRAPDSEAEVETPPAKPTFVWSPYSLGAVVALEADEPFPGTSGEWGWILNTLRGDRWQWTRRHGTNVRGGSADFWSFLIPGVGLVPVLEFQVLITVFVLAIGPVNYFLLRRRRQLQLLVLTVPGCAVVITLALFAYGLVSDGFAVRVRPRSFTELDQRTGHAVCWTRLSYYAGLAPRAGLTFSSDVAVMPISQESQDYYSERRRAPRFVDWGRMQHLSEGWLRSRTPTQFLTMRARKSTLRLDIEPSAAGFEVENHLGTAIEHLLVVDEDGNAFWGDALAENATSKLAAISLSQALDRLDEIADEHIPTMPTSFVPGQQRYSFGPRSSRYYYGYGTLSAAGPGQMETSRLEDGLDWMREGFRWLGTSGNTVQAEVRRTYLAVVEESPEVEIGVEEAEIAAPLHVIRGSW